MSNPIAKGAKRPSSRPQPLSSPKTSAKSRKLAAKPVARPNSIAKRSSAEKSPVRKADPGKAASAPAKSAKTSKSAKQVAPAPKSGAKTTRAAATVTPAKAAKTASRQPSKTPAAKTPAKNVAAPTKSRTTSAPKSGAQKSATHRQAAPTRQPTRDEAAALRSFERAHKEFTRGRFVEARNLFRALIEEHAGVAEVTARARTYLSIAEARMRTESALPRDAEALYDRGVIELNRGDYVAAQELFERALKRDEQAPDTHYALAATRSRLGNVELALQSLQRALELRPGLRIRAQYDPDFAPLRNEPEYERLVFASRV